jgi:hypothetical protein
MDKYYGFDLGDAESAVSLLKKEDKGEPEVLELNEQKSFITAYALLRDGTLIIGENACYEPDAVQRKLRFKSRVAALVFANEPAVQIDLGIMRRSAKAHKGFFVDATAQIQPFAVAANHLVDALVKIVVGKQLAGVRQTHRLAGAFTV